MRALLLTLLGGVCLSAQTVTAPGREITLITGRGELISFDADIKTVAVSEPKIADGVVVSPREVMISAKSPGRSTIIVWESNQLPRRYEVHVVNDQTDLDLLKKAIRDALPEAAIEITGNKETIVLTGSVKTQDEAKRAGALASTHARNVVNLLQTPAPGDPRQILLEVKFASVDRVALSELGFNYFSRNAKTLGSLTTQQFQQPRFSQLQFQEQEFANSTINFADLLNLFIFRPDLNIGATIRALQGRNLLQILAEPNLIAIEGTEASFLAGGEFPFPTLTATTTGGAVAPVITVQFKRFGVQLGFLPTITPSGAIHLKVRPEVSALDFANAVQLQGFLIPAVSSRRAETEVILKDGESFAVAGLLDNRVVQTANRIPGLGDIPIVGQLFRSRALKKSSDELMVLVTPRFVRPLTPEERAKLPEPVEPFLPTIEQEKAAKAKKGSKGRAEAPKPEFVGPRGHQNPNRK